jgi:hypothetical protein
MGNEAGLILNGQIPNVMKSWTPAELALEGKNLKAAGATAYTSDFVDVTGCTNFQIVLKTAVVGTVSAGAAKLSITFYDYNEVQISPTHDVVTAISTQVNGQCAVVGFGGGVAAAAINGTVGTNVGALRGASKAKITLTVSTQGDAVTSQTGDVYFNAWAN